MALQSKNLRSRYGISSEEYNKIFKQQGGVCIICGLPPRKRSLHVDHNHETGEIRGLLCHLCNVGLGHFRDNPDLLERAANYLR
jgi:Recombination endonuclease VII